MGYPSAALIPPAILLENPGITREEFVELLNRTHCTILNSFENIQLKTLKGLPPKFDYEGHHLGLHGLARVLCLQRQDIGEESKPTEIDRKVTAPTQFGIKGRIKRKEWKGPVYYINYPQAILGKTETLTIVTKGRRRMKPCPNFRLIDYPEKTNMPFFPDRLSQIYGVTITDVKNQRGGLTTFKVRKAIDQSRIEKFPSLESLLEKHPKFHPDLMYDFSQSQGEFTWLDNYAEKGHFMWKKEGNRYYFDQDCFDRMREGPRADPRTLYGYTCLILTTEAIKHKAWKFLSWRGRLDKTNDLLKEFPDIYKRYARAVWDSHTSLYAKSKGMTHSELMRLRLLPTNASPINF